MGDSSPVGSGHRTSSSYCLGSAGTVCNFERGTAMLRRCPRSVALAAAGKQSRWPLALLSVPRVIDGNLGAVARTAVKCRR